MTDPAGGRSTAATIQLVANIGVIATIAIMWLIYMFERDDQMDLQRKQTATAVLEVSYQDAVASAERSVNQFINENYDGYMDLYRASVISEPSMEAGTDAQSAAMTLDADMAGHFVTLTSYYDDVLTCRDSGNCDSAMIDAWFREDVCAFSEFGELFGFPQLRERYGQQLGARLRLYAEQHCAQAAQE